VGFKNRVLRRIFGPKKDEVTGEWRRLHNEELYALYFSPNIILVIESRRIRWKGHVAHMGERTGAYRILVEKSDGRFRHRYEDNIKIYLRELGWKTWTEWMWIRIGTGGGFL
jgi:hypothetical protein